MENRNSLQYNAKSHGMANLFVKSINSIAKLSMLLAALRMLSLEERKPNYQVDQATFSMSPDTCGDNGFNETSIIIFPNQTPTVELQDIERAHTIVQMSIQVKNRIWFIFFNIKTNTMYNYNFKKTIEQIF